MGRRVTPLDQNTNLNSQKNALRTLQQEIPALVAALRVAPEGLTLRTAPAKVRALSNYIRNSSLLRFQFLIDIAVVDKLRTTGRFVVNYSFLSTVINQRITVQLYASETTTIPSLAAPFFNNQRLFASAS